MKKIDLCGLRFRRLLVISENRQRQKAKITWNCLCDCGKIIIVAGSDLRGGKTVSCGCWKKECNTTHGGPGLAEYRTWEEMRKRCTNPKATKYEHYGGRGIKVCDRWGDFCNFYEDMGPIPFAGATIDRIDVNGNYEKTNCRWASRTEQARNQRIPKRNSSGVVGVRFEKRGGTYTANIWMNNKNMHLGTLPTLEEAAAARKRGEAQYWGKEDHP